MPARCMSRAEWDEYHFNYELRTDKPPLHYYFMKAGYAVFGVNPFGARFFSVVFGVLTLLITFYYTRRFLGYNTAVWAAIVLCIASFCFGISPGGARSVSHFFYDPGVYGFL
ncbi:MAG: glycosyltransferase family 39 protein [Bacteroidales bacterium]|nr:glycosyltransferase family 39 protein [Bacteroidales bacterium]